MKRQPRSNSPWIVLLVALAGMGSVSATENPAVGASRGPTAAEVREAALVTHFHGITDEIARETVGLQGVPHLVTLLKDPEFPRRDNVVALLAWLGFEETVPHLLALLESPPGPSGVPEENRAMLLVPQALGHLASRQSRGALESLLAMTADGSGGGVLSIPSQAGRPRPGRDDLIEAAIRGLALSGNPEAVERLTEISEGRVRPAPEGRDPRGAARMALALVDELGRAPQADSATEPSRAVSLQGSAGPRLGESAVAPLIAGDLDLQQRVHDSPLTFANHPEVGSPMDNFRVDEILREASVVAGRDDYDLDIACCITVSRSGDPGTFGQTGDGLTVIDNQDEMYSVLNDPAGRVKVVTAINWCGDPGMNIIGCSWTPGNGMAVVRMLNVSVEAILWIHEYGHNVELGHTSDARDIMYGSNSGQNRGLDQAECNAFHLPPLRAGMTVVDMGTCADDDDDSVHDVVDNCEGFANTSQVDTDMDGVGDACELADTDGDGVLNGDDNCPTSPNAGQEDLDNDGRGDACDPDDDDDGVNDTADNCPATANPSQSDADADGLGDECDPCNDADGDGYGSPGSAGCDAGADGDCDDGSDEVRPGAPELCDGRDNDCDLELDEALCEDFDIDGDDAVDGREVAWLARAFGQCGGPSLWWNPVDYTNDGCVDGDDLAFLASVWNCSHSGPVCE